MIIVVLYKWTLLLPFIFKTTARHMTCHRCLALVRVAVTTKRVLRYSCTAGAEYDSFFTWLFSDIFRVCRN